jgi:hypothetical protein
MAEPDSCVLGPCARVPRCNLTIHPTLRAHTRVLTRPVASHFGLPHKGRHRTTAHGTITNTKVMNMFSLLIIINIFISYQAAISTMNPYPISV